MSSDRIIEIYEHHTEAWVQARNQESFYEQTWLDRFCSLIPVSGTVLDCGCGSGEPIAKYLSRCGYAVTGIDSSAAMVRMFQARLPNQHAMVADMRALCLAKTFHGILAWDSFFHLNHEDQRGMFSVFRAHSSPGTALIFTSGPSSGEAFGLLEGEPLYHASLDAAEYSTLLQDQGFAVLATVVKDQDCGGRTVWLARYAPDIAGCSSLGLDKAHNTSDQPSSV